jgi:hypothetical protein
VVKAGTIRKALKTDYLSQPVLAHFQWGLMLVGALFWAQASMTHEAFDAALYGEFALVFRAEAWAMAMMAPSAMILIGLRQPVKRWMVAIGAALQALQFSALGYSALWTGGEPIIGIFCLVLFLPLFVRMAVEARSDP